MMSVNMGYPKKINGIRGLCQPMRHNGSGIQYGTLSISLVTTTSCLLAVVFNKLGTILYINLNFPHRLFCVQDRHVRF